MDFFIDENLPLSVASELRDNGFEAEHVREVGLKGTDDSEVAAYAKRKDAVLVTKDLEFGSPKHYPPESHIGVIIVRIPAKTGVSEINKRINSFIENTSTEDITGKVTVLEKSRYRTREL